jgi:hypothetical protein
MVIKEPQWQMARSLLLPIELHLWLVLLPKLTRSFIYSCPLLRHLFVTIVCPTEIIAFSERAKEFASLGAEVVACSVDSQFSTLAWINTPREKGGLGNMNIPVISDVTHEISARYGIPLLSSFTFHSLVIAIYYQC